MIFMADRGSATGLSDSGRGFGLSDRARVELRVLVVVDWVSRPAVGKVLWKSQVIDSICLHFPIL